MHTILLLIFGGCKSTERTQRAAMWWLRSSDLYYCSTHKAQFKFKYTVSIHNVAFQHVLFPQKTEDQLDSTIIQ